MGRNRTGDKGYLSEVCLGRLLSVLFSVSADKVPSSHPSTGDALGHQWGFQKGLVSGFPGGSSGWESTCQCRDMGSIPGPGGSHMLRGN